MTMAMVLAMAMLAGLGKGPDVTEKPIQLVTESVGNGVRLIVVGDVTVPTEASYALEVSSDAAGGGNKSVQRGTARLVPGGKTRLMTLTLGNVGHGQWSATLSVDPKPGRLYREQIRSD